MAEVNFEEIFKAFPLPFLLLKPEPEGLFTIASSNQAYLEILPKNESASKRILSINNFPGLQNQDKNEAYEWFITSLLYVFRKKTSDKKERISLDIQNKEFGHPEKSFWNISNKAILDDNKEIKYLFITFRNITPLIISEERQKKFEKELESKKQQEQHFYEANQDGLYSLDLNGRFTSGNSGIAKITGVEIPHLLKKTFIPFCAPEDKERTLQYFKKTLQGNNTRFEGNFVSSKGREMFLDISLMPMKVDDAIVGAYGIAKDITEKRRNEKIIIEKKKYLKANAALITSLLQNQLQQESMKDAFGMVAATIGVDRMYYFGSHTNEETGETLISQKIEWCSKNAEPQINNPEMLNMSAGKLEEIMGPLTKNLPFVASLNELPECEMKKIFIDQNIKSMLLLPIFLHQQFYGFIGFDDCTKERIWTEDEVTFLKNLTHNFMSALEKNEAEETLQKQEEQLKLSEQKFKALVQAGTDLISILDREGNYIFLSATTKPVLGIKPQEFLGKNVFDFIHPEDVKRAKNKFLELLNHEKQIKISPFRFKDKEGNWRWIEATITNMLDHPAVKGMVCNARDITTIVTQAREIENINERYRLAATATKDLIYDWDLEKDEVFRFHRSLKELYGYTSEEIDKKDFWRKYIHPDDVKSDLRKLRAALSNPEEHFIITEYRFQRADGTYANVVDKGYIIRNKDGKAIRIVGATSDISELTAKEEALKIANKRFELAMEATKEMIWEWDIESNIVVRSSIYSTLYGYKNNNESETNAFWLTKVHPKDTSRTFTSIQDALKNKVQKKWFEEYRFIKADGSIAYIKDRGYIIRDENGNPKRMVGAVLDVTDSRRWIKEIKTQNKILKEIAWEQSHLVRAPLTRLKGLLNLLEYGEGDKMTSEEILFHLKDSANELDEITRDIVMKTEQVKMKSCQTR